MARSGLAQWSGVRTPTRSRTTSPTSGMINPASLQDKLTADYEQTRLDRQQRYQQGMGLFGQIADLYKPGGAFEQAAMQQYALGKQQTLTSGMQNLISSGLAKGSNLGAMERGYEASVGTPFRIGVAAEGQGRLASAYQNMAGYMANFPDVYPTAGTLAHLATGGFGALSNQAAQASAQTSANYQATGGSLWGRDLLARGGTTAGGGTTTGGGATGGGQTGRAGTASPFANNPYRTGANAGGGGSVQFDPAMIGNPNFSLGQGGGMYALPVSDLYGGGQVLPSQLTDEQLNPAPPVSELSSGEQIPLTRSGPYKGDVIGSGDRKYYWTKSGYRLWQG